MLAIPTIMHTLAQARPIFHSEADFQHAFAWELHNRLPDAQVRLEFPLAMTDKRLHLDIWAADQDRAAAIELKYPTRKLAVDVGGERYQLAEGAADLSLYEYIKDIQRLEQITALRAGVVGYAVLLTNDNLHWTAAPGTNAAAFRLPEGRELTGTVTWGAKAAPGTTKGYERPLTLAGRYPIHWRDYAHVGGERWGQFRYLAVVVPPAAA